MSAENEPYNSHVKLWRATIQDAATRDIDLEAERYDIMRERIDIAHERVPEPDEDLALSPADILFMSCPGPNEHVWAFFLHQENDHYDAWYSEDGDDDYAGDDMLLFTCDHVEAVRCKYLLTIHYKDKSGETAKGYIGTGYLDVALEMKFNSEQLGHYVELEDTHDRP